MYHRINDLLSSLCNQEKIIITVSLCMLEIPAMPRPIPHSLLRLNKQSTLMIEDWEIGQLYWNCLKRHEGHDSESKACADVRKKYLDDHAKTKDVHLFLGTFQQFHFVGRNPFTVIGTFYPIFPAAKKEESQLKLF